VSREQLAPAPLAVLLPVLSQEKQLLLDGKEPKTREALSQRLLIFSIKSDVAGRERVCGTTAFGWQ